MGDTYSCPAPSEATAGPCYVVVPVADVRHDPITIMIIGKRQGARRRPHVIEWRGRARGGFETSARQGGRSLSAAASSIPYPVAMEPGRASEAKHVIIRLAVLDPLRPVCLFNVRALEARQAGTRRPFEASIKPPQVCVQLLVTWFSPHPKSRRPLLLLHFLGTRLAISDAVAARDIVMQDLSHICPGT